MENNKDYEIVLKKIIKEITNDNNCPFYEEENFSFIDDLGFDSIEIMQLIFEIDDRFDVGLAESEECIEVIQNYKTLKEWLYSKL